VERKFKIGEVVRYRLNTASAHAIGGTFRVIGFLRDIRGEPVYRIQPSKGEPRIAAESELWTSPTK
jgi:hypothetical protein